jgi:hypothetical protein
MTRPRKKVIAVLKLLQSEGLGHLTLDEALAREQRQRARKRGRPKGSMKWTEERLLDNWERYHRLRATKGLGFMEASRERGGLLGLTVKTVARRIAQARRLGPARLEVTLGPLTLEARGKVFRPRLRRRGRSK